MRNVLAVALFWLLTTFIAYAEIPKAKLTINTVNFKQWPIEFQLTLTVPQGYHAYLNQGDGNFYIPVSIDPKQKLANQGLSIKILETPAGHYDKDVKAIVLREKGDFTLALIRKDGQQLTADTVNLDVTYQLCSEVTHVCFRPQTSQVNLTLPTTPKPRVDSTPSPSVIDQLLRLFSNNQDNTATLFGLMLLAGILSVATPCVYPMLPITSMFIVNRGNGIAKQEKLHALVYLIGIIGTYVMLGLIAGMTGGAFNTFMQSAWINLGFAAFFAFFAISLLDFYELSFMQNQVHNLDQQSARIQGLTGTWLMGTVAGLVISPCVGPIVFALLLQVANNIADQCNQCIDPYQTLSFWRRLSIASQGGIMMAGFGLGVGLPFFLISVLKFKKLPKAGYWLNKIKYAFALTILYFAYVYFHKGMAVLGVEPSATRTLAFGMLAVWIAVAHCNVLSLLPADAQPQQKTVRFCGVLSLIVGAWLMIAGLQRTPIMANTQADCLNRAGNQSTATLAIEKTAGILWYRDFAAAQKAAQQTGKPIFIDFYADWCANCVAFKEEAANNPQLNQALRQKAVTVKLIDKEPEFEKFRKHPEHQQLKIGLPYFAILSPDGKLIWSGTDYTATEKMVAVLSQQQGKFPQVM